MCICWSQNNIKLQKNVYSVDIWKENRRGNPASTVSSDKLCFVDHTRENINDGAYFSAGTKDTYVLVKRTAI